jgi:hypothetical protein
MPELRDTPINQSELSPLVSSIGADLGVFYSALQDQIDETLDRAKSEGWDSERFINEVGKLLEPEEDGEVMKSLNDRIVIRHYGSISGFDIEIVDEEYIRQNIFIDFTEGGNHERYSWIPENQIWIGDDVSAGEIVVTVFHEFTEQRFMRDGNDYDTAHDMATEMEDAMRHDDELKDRFERLIRIEPVLKSAVDLKIQKALVQIRSAIPDEVFSGS